MENKFAKLSNGLIVIPVEKDISSVGLWIELNILQNTVPQFKYLGWITKDGCSFDCSKYINAWDDMSFEGFKDLIEFETDFRFENPLGGYNHAIKRHIVTGTWQEFQDKVVEKLIVVKEHEILPTSQTP